MRVTLRRRKGDRSKFVQSRMGSIPVDYSRMEGLVEIVHIVIPDEDAKGPLSAVTIAKSVVREARTAGRLAKTAETGKTTTLLLHEWPRACVGLGIKLRQIKPETPQEPPREASGGPLYEKPGLCPACGGELVEARMGVMRGLYYCERTCYKGEREAEEIKAVTSPDEGPVVVEPIVFGESVKVREVPLQDVLMGERIKELEDAIDAFRQVIDDIKKSLSTPRS